MRSGPARLLLPRLLGALSCRVATFREVAADPYAGIQSGIIVVIVGMLEAAAHARLHDPPELATIEVMFYVLASLIGCVMWTVILWLTGTRIFGHAVEFGGVLRAVAFAYATSLPFGLAAVPVLVPWNGLLRATTGLWFVFAMYGATRGLFDAAHRRAAAILGVSLAARLLVELLPEGLRLVPGT